MIRKDFWQTALIGAICYRQLGTTPDGEPLYCRRQLPWQAMDPLPEGVYPYTCTCGRGFALHVNAEGVPTVRRRKVPETILVGEATP